MAATRKRNDLRADNPADQMTLMFGGRDRVFLAAEDERRR
jgi:hypothetical protein